MKAGRVCEGYSPASEPSPLPIGHRFVHYVDKTEIGRMYRSPSPLINFDAASLRAWDFFLNSTAIQLQHPFPAKLWTQYLTCFAQSNDAIKHGIIALASLHENFMQHSDPGSSATRHVLALEHYGKSINAVVRANQRDTQSAVLTTLVSSMLFCAIEGVQGHMSSALKHIIAGLSVLADNTNTILAPDSEENKAFPGFAQVLQDIFQNMAGNGLSFEDRPFISNTKLTGYIRSSRTLSELPLTSITRARRESIHLFNDILLFLTWSDSRQNEPDYPDQDLIDAAEELQQRYEASTQSYHGALSASPGLLQSNHPERRALLELRVNQLLARISLTIKFGTTQSAFDQCRSEFAAIVQVCEDLINLERHDVKGVGSPVGSARFSPKPETTFTLGLGVIPGLFYTCTRCRDPGIRYRALQALKNMKRRECLWDSDTVSIVAERFVQIEEQRAREYWQQQGLQPDMAIDDISQQPHLTSTPLELIIPEEARIHSLLVDLPKDDEGQGSIAFMASGNRQADIMLWDGYRPSGT